MKRTAGILAFGFVATVTASAQEGAPTPKAEVGMSFSSTTVFPSGGVPSFTAPGGSGTFVYNFNKTFGAVADLGAYHNSSDANLDPTTFSYLFGPRVSWRKDRFTPYAQALVGGVRVTSPFLVDPISGNTTAQNAFATAFGGGLDLRATDHIYLKPVEVDYMLSRVPNFWSLNNTQSNLRYSAGIVFRFGKK